MFYVHEEFPDHPKWESVQESISESDPDLFIALVGFWTACGCDCRARLTDGRITLLRAARVACVTVERATVLADKLCFLRFWKKAADGYQFHDWSDVQDTKLSVQARRIKWKNAKRSRKDSTSETLSDSGEDSSLESRTNRRGEERRGEELDLRSPEQPAKPKRERKVKTPETTLPAEWIPTESHHKFAAEHGINIGMQVIAFRGHAEANDRRQVNWNGTFTTWLVRCASQPQSGYAPRNGLSLSMPSKSPARRLVTAPAPGEASQ